MNTALIDSLNKDLAIELPANIAFADLQKKLVEYINHLILHNFEKLVSLLYRIDVSENKIKQLLQLNADKDAAETIAHLIIERQLEKIKTRGQFKQQQNNSEEEKW